jgi:hypothetical protein
MTYFSRGKNVIVNPYTFADMYKDYIKAKDKDSPYYVTYEEYVSICSIFYKEMSRLIIDEGSHFKLPFALGEVFVRKRKPKINSKLPIDWLLSTVLHKRVYNFNEHTGGYTYKFFWTKPYSVVNKFMYRLVFTRDNKRRLAKVIKEQHKDYFEK